jgi:hypothetical protein
MHSAFSFLTEQGRLIPAWTSPEAKRRAIFSEPSGEQSSASQAASNLQRLHLQL